MISDLDIDLFPSPRFQLKYLLMKLFHQNRTGPKVISPDSNSNIYEENKQTQNLSIQTPF